ncbi:MAG: type II toxin-antitoxin system RelE/ParE family toxin [Thermomicrobiales bacterium]
MRELVWVGSSLDDLKEFPEVVQRGMGYALWLAQTGGKHPDAKPLKGFGGAGVLEVVDDDEGDTYRTIYTLTLSDAVYVLHAFQKKSKQGIATSQRDKKLIEQRLKWAREMHAERKQALGRDER